MKYVKILLIIVTIGISQLSCKNEESKKTDREKLEEFARKHGIIPLGDSTSNRSIEELMKIMKAHKDTIKGSGTGYIDPKARNSIDTTLNSVDQKRTN